MNISDPITVTSDLQIAGRDASIINSTDIDLARVVADPQVRQIAADLSRWVNNARAAAGRTSMFDRGAYSPPDNPYDEMRAARHALKYDSVVSGVAEVTEGIAFVGLKWEGENADDADVFNQWSRDVNLDQVVRSMWREEFAVSQAVVAMVWGWSEYTVRGKTTKGNARKKNYRVWCPQTMRTLNPARVVPIDLGPLGGDRLAWASSVLEVGYYQDCYLGRKIDPLMLAFFKGTYTPPEDDVLIMSRWHVDVNNLLEMDSDWVFRHTATKSDYEPFPEPRLKSCFGLLDLKMQLMAADRGALIGNALRNDQRVLTPAGWFPISGLCVGDEVVGADGRPTAVEAVHPQGPRALYRIGFSDGAQVIADGQHLWSVWVDNDMRKDLKVFSTNQMIERGLRRGTKHSFSVPIVRAVQMPEADLPVDPYLLGVLLGDGGLTSCNPKISSSDPDQNWLVHLPDDVKITGYQLERKVPTWSIAGTDTPDFICIEPACERPRLARGLCRNHYAVHKRRGVWPEHTLEGRNSLTNGLRKLALWGCDFKEKFIPEMYLTASAEQRWELFQGLCDTDSSPCTSGIVEFSSSSPELARGMVDLARSLGFLATLTTRTPKGATTEAYRVFVSTIGDRNPFRRSDRSVKWSPRQTRLVRTVVSIEPVPVDEATCITVANSDGLFVTEGHVVTHNCNYILHLKQGDKDLPARNEEMVALKDRYNTFSKVPVIISDHRLNIEIIAPKTDLVLDGSKYEVLDNRILNRLLGTLTISGRGQRNETQVTISEIVARSMENRRHMIARSVEEHVARAVVNHPKNAGVFQSSAPSLVFTPRNISLDANQSVIQALLALRAQREVSRETTLEYFGLDQETEAQRLEMEDERWADIFKTLVMPGQVPVGGAPGAQPGPNGTGEAPAVSGGRGGRPKGGGTTPANPVKRAKPRGAGGSPSTKAAEETE